MAGGVKKVLQRSEACSPSGENGNDHPEVSSHSDDELALAFGAHRLRSPRHWMVFRLSLIRTRFLSFAYAFPRLRAYAQSLPTRQNAGRSLRLCRAFCACWLVWLAQHSLPDVRTNNMKREEDAHSLIFGAPLLASHDSSIIDGMRRVSRPSDFACDAAHFSRFAFHSSPRMA